MRETGRHREAFEYFVELGGVLSDDNCMKLSQRFHVTVRSIRGWSAKLGWISRADRIFEKVHDKILEKQVNEAVKAREKQLAEVRQLKAFLLSTIQNAIDKESKSSKIKPETSIDVASLARSVNELIKTESLLLGDPTDRTDLTTAVIISPAGKREEIGDDPE